MSLVTTRTIGSQPAAVVDVTSRESIHSAIDTRIQKCRDSIRVYQLQYNDMPNVIVGCAGSAACGAALIYSGDLKWGTALLLAGLAATLFAIYVKGTRLDEIQKCEDGIARLGRLKDKLSTPEEISKFAASVQATNGTTALAFDPFYFAFKKYNGGTV